MNWHLWDGKDPFFVWWYHEFSSDSILLLHFFKKLIYDGTRAGEADTSICWRKLESQTLEFSLGFSTVFLFLLWSKYTCKKLRILEKQFHSSLWRKFREIFQKGTAIHIRILSQYTHIYNIFSTIYHPYFCKVGVLNKSPGANSRTLYNTSKKWLGHINCCSINVVVDAGTDMALLQRGTRWYAFSWSSLLFSQMWWQYTAMPTRCSRMVLLIANETIMNCERKFRWDCINS